jgi:hypothetical protein
MQAEVIELPRRTVRDPEGQVWQVREFVQHQDGHEDRSLLFDNGIAIRRVRDFPTSWHSLPERELMKVSRRR